MLRNCSRSRAKARSRTRYSASDSGRSLPVARDHARCALGNLRRRRRNSRASKSHVNGDDKLHSSASAPIAGPSAAAKFVPRKCRQRSQLRAGQKRLMWVGSTCSGGRVVRSEGPLVIQLEAGTPTGCCNVKVVKHSALYLRKHGSRLTSRSRERTPTRHTGAATGPSRRPPARKPWSSRSAPWFLRITCDRCGGQGGRLGVSSSLRGRVRLMGGN